MNVQIHYSFWEEKYLGENKDDNVHKSEDQLIRQINKHLTNIHYSGWGRHILTLFERQLVKTNYLTNPEAWPSI